MKASKLQLLIDNMLNTAERKQIMDEIKNNPIMKAELAFMLKVREKGREQKKEQLSLIKTGNMASISLSQIRSAAFNTKFAFEVDPLPISEETITDFLTDDDD